MHTECVTLCVGDFLLHTIQLKSLIVVTSHWFLGHLAGLAVPKHSHQVCLIDFIVKVTHLSSKSWKNIPRTVLTICCLSTAEFPTRKKKCHQKQHLPLWGFECGSNMTPVLQMWISISCKSQPLFCVSANYQLGALLLPWWERISLLGVEVKHPRCHWSVYSVLLM